MMAHSHPSLRRPFSQGFECGESLQETEEDEICVAFYCTTPNNNRLEFLCREPSCGVLTDSEAAVEQPNDTMANVDPNFFDKGYTLAGKTGFMVWAGSRLLVEALTWRHSADCLALQQVQDQVCHGAKVLELGSGVGVVGACLANSGAQVLLTDLPTLVEHSVQPNLERIGSDKMEERSQWLSAADTHPVKIGKGWASCMSVDWTVPIDQQLPKELQRVDVIVASDCVWLVSMLEALFSTVHALFRAGSSKLILSFQRRDPADGSSSVMFSSVDRVLAEVKQRTWACQCLAWRPLDDDKEEENSNEVFVFEIVPC